ncbi:hypothetical protein E2562_000234 [Oryza meyeriana var. granulata]|uniref:Uncharacterized protein n=1 Tax=Oryza meyeriana var. granulata TaxID=110450 RepID=A0A6G1CMK2_9ORYZ|nr:hypothetical protein E2562_000234 [Oryza meyeriana var. granulata]
MPPANEKKAFWGGAAGRTKEEWPREVCAWLIVPAAVTGIGRVRVVGRGEEASNQGALDFGTMGDSTVGVVVVHRRCAPNCPQGGSP